MSDEFIKLEQTAQKMTYKKQLNTLTLSAMFFSGKPLIPAQSAYSTPTNSNYELLQAAIKYNKDKNDMTSNQPK